MQQVLAFSTERWLLH